MKSLENRPIGIFDSGVGGLTVLKSVRSHLPSEDIVYFGDTARVPYGNKSRSTIIRFSREIISFLIKKEVKMVIAACNTSSSLALPFIRKEYSVPVIGVIKPGVEAALKVSPNRRVGVIGTLSTITSGAYERELLKKDKGYKVFSRSCPMFVPLVENKLFSDPAAFRMADIYLKGFRKKKVDALILGCTHYPLLKNTIRKVTGGVKLIDSSVAVAKYVRGEIEKRDIAARRGKGRTYYYVSDDPEGFCKIAGIFLREKVQARKVVL